MARTRLGREMTEAHKHGQIGLVTQFYAASRILLGELDPARLDATVTAWAGLQMMLTESFHRDSARLARSYMTEFRAAEVSQVAAASMPVVEPVFDAASMLNRLEPVSPMVKIATGRGLRPQDAVDQVFWQMVGGWGRHVQAGGRDLIDQSTLANPDSTGWRRVSDGDPCAWCGMLVTRGPAYRSAATAGEGRRYHDRCGCTVEEVFGEWVPTAAEQRMIDVYKASHRPGMSAEETAAAMRENGQGVLNDARKPKTQAGGAGGGSGGGGKPPPRVRGMLGPDAPDEFPSFDGWQPPAKRSEIALPTAEQVKLLLDGDPDSDSGHGYHRAGSGRGKSEWPLGWGQDEVLEWLSGVIDHPADGAGNSAIFHLVGDYRDVFGIIHVMYDGPGSYSVGSWYRYGRRQWTQFKRRLSQ